MGSHAGVFGLPLFESGFAPDGLILAEEFRCALRIRLDRDEAVSKLDSRPTHRIPSAEAALLSSGRECSGIPLDELAHAHRRKPLYATLEDRIFGRAQREMTDEEKKDLEIYCGASFFVDYREMEKHLRNEAAIILMDMLLAKFVGRKNTPELRKEIVEDLFAFAQGEKKR